MTTAADEFPRLLDLALAEAQDLTRRLMDRLRLGEYAVWRLEDRTGRLVFDKPGGPAVSLLAQVAGTLDPAAGRWQWAWDDPDTPAAFARAALAAQGVGAASDIPVLTTGTTPATEADAWRRTAFVARLIGWPGVYRGPAAGGRLLFLAFAPPPGTEGADLVTPSPVAHRPAPPES